LSTPLFLSGRLTHVGQMPEARVGFGVAMATNQGRLFMSKLKAERARSETRASPQDSAPRYIDAFAG